MFARKKPQDFQASLQRFTDLARDSQSRVKHFRLLFDNLNAQEKKQMVEGFSFETYHLIDGLMIAHYDTPIEQQTIVDVEAALSILEQVLLYAPEFVGKGWQRNGIEFLLKMVLHPRNVQPVRRLAIRLFILWYQTLAVCGHGSTNLDAIFQCCLPHFPLQDGRSTEQILTVLCEGTSAMPATTNGSNNNNNGCLNFQPMAAKSIPIVGSQFGEEDQQQQQPLAQDPQTTTTIGIGTAGGPSGAGGRICVRERAQTLQKYLDKFLEYTTRETVKIQWTDAGQRLNCAKFLLDRIISLYIYELFPEAEANGIDVFQGWEGTFEEEMDGTAKAPMLLDTSEPSVIAKYWLIRWMTNIAFESQLSNSAQQQANSSSPGLDLFKQALFSSQKATNILLTLMREAFRLPLSCVNVIQKVLQLLRLWLLQQELPPFVQSLSSGEGQVSLESWTLLLGRMLFSFFSSPYLLSTGDKLASAVSIAHMALQIVRDLANPLATALARPLPKAIWQELVHELLAAVQLITSRADAFGQATSAGFTRTLLSVLIFVRVIRDIPLDDSLWDQVLAIFRGCQWPGPVMEQWSRIVSNVTRALVLNLFSVEIDSVKGSDHEEFHHHPTTNCPTSFETGSSTGSHGFGVGYQPSKTDLSSDSGSVPGAGGTLTSSAAFLSADCGGLGEDDKLLMVGRTGSTSSLSAAGGDGATIGGGGVVQCTGNAVTWLRVWMRVISLAADSLSPTSSTASSAASSSSTPAASSSSLDDQQQQRHSPQQQLAVQTVGRSLQMLAQLGAPGQPLLHWLCAHLLRLNVVEQPHAIPHLFTALIGANPPPLERAYILHQLLQGLQSAEVAPLVLDHMPGLNNVEDMALLSTETITTLQKLVKNQEFSARAIRVAALLSLNHPEAEKILLSLLDQRQLQIDQCSLSLCVNALCLLILERADAALFDRLRLLLANHQYAARTLPIFCANLGLVVRLGFHSQLIESLLLAQSKVKNVNALNDLKWQLCAICSREPITTNCKGLWERFTSAKDHFFEGFAIRLSGQFPLPGFQITHWNSLPAPTGEQQQQQNAAAASSAAEEAYNGTYLEMEGSILSLDKSNPQTLWSRSCLGKFAYRIEQIPLDEEQPSPVDQWLRSLVNNEQKQQQQPNSNSIFQSAGSARKKSSPAVEELFDPFQELPFPRPRAYTYYASSSSSAPSPQELLTPLDISVPEMLQFIQASNRSPEEFPPSDDDEERKGNGDKDDGEEIGGGPDREWRRFLISTGLLGSAKEGPANFQRDIRHLDSTICREVHKVAVIFVGKDQQDKQAILSNNSGSEGFNKFVDGLGWPVKIGSPDFFGYAGGLPAGQWAPYYATANTELVFHVSTLLNGDTTQRLKHLGNDEVHVVWSENPGKPYRRELIATRFCDVLIVLYVVSPVLLRVHIEVQDQRLQFGPLFDGACVHSLQAASLVRETVLNASRAYRNLHIECDRPNKHREKVFSTTKQMLRPLPLAAAITRLSTQKRQKQQQQMRRPED